MAPKFGVRAPPTVCTVVDFRVYSVCGAYFYKENGGLYCLTASQEVLVIMAYLGLFKGVVSILLDQKHCKLLFCRKLSTVFACTISWRCRLL